MGFRWKTRKISIGNWPKREGRYLEDTPSLVNPRLTAIVRPEFGTRHT